MNQLFGNSADRSVAPAIVAEAEDNKQLQVDESHILQGRSIGVFGAISLIVNKIVGAGCVWMGPLCTHADFCEGFSLLLQPFSSLVGVLEWHL